MEEIGSRNFRAYVKALLSNSILKRDISRNAVIESLMMIDSSLHEFKYQNIKEHSGVYKILTDSYLALMGCDFPDLISIDQCTEAYERMICCAHTSLMNIADGIADRSFRKTFLEKIPAHREIVRRSDELDVSVDDQSCN